MLPSQNLQNRSFPSAIGSNEQAAFTSIEGEGEIIDEGLGSGRRMAVNSRVSESEAVDDNGGIGTGFDDCHFGE